MSGLSGIVSFDGHGVSARAVSRMLQAAAYRGPDGSAVWAGDGAALGHQALALLPAEHDGPQPLVEGPLVLVADARLDNRAELVSALRRSGELAADGRTPSDARVVLAAFRRWRERCAEHLVGDFAFAVWDGERRRLYAARDPLGMRSLAYRCEPGRRALFATEVRQLVAAPGVPSRLFEPAVAADLAGHFGRAEWSFFEGIGLLPPGHALVCDRSGQRVTRFWDVDPSHRVRHADLGGYVDHLRATFTEAVAARVRTDKPVGFLLSGGMDSGSAASSAGWLMERAAVPRRRVVACQWAFEELAECDERAVSRRIVERYGFTGLEIPADGAGPLSCFPEHLPHPDDPMLGAFQPLIEHALAALSGHGAGVVLGGDRGDLVLGDTGYSYLRMAEARQWDILRAELRTHRAVLDDRVRDLVRRHLLAALVGRARRRSAREWARWAVGRLRNGRPPPRPSPPPWLPAALVARTGLADLLAEEPHVPAGLEAGAAERYRLVFTPLHVRGMAWSERTYARFGLGFADPFSDARLVALAVGLPRQIINRPGDQTKPLLRAAMRGVMPEEARTAADKVLPMPLYDRSLARAAPLVHDLLEGSCLGERGWVEPGALRDHYDAWLGGSGRLRPEFWWALGVEVWLRTHFA